MAKRFTDTVKFRKDWIRRLPATYKLFWCYILDDCSNAGIWEVDLEIASLILGVELSKKTALQLFNENKQRIIEFDDGVKWFIIPFIEFQYGELNADFNPHKSIISTLKKNKLLCHIKSITGVPVGYQGRVPWYPTNGTLPMVGYQEKEQEQEKEKEKELYKEQLKDQEIKHSHARARNVFKPPTPQEVIEYAKSKGFQIDGEFFCCYYAARGWHYKGNVAMKNWKAAVITWEKQSKKNGQISNIDPIRANEERRRNAINWKKSE